MNLKILASLICISLISFSVQANSYYNLNEVDEIYNAKCTGKMSGVTAESITQMKIYYSGSSGNDNFGASVSISQQYEHYKSIFLLDAPLSYETIMRTRNFAQCPDNNWFQVSRPCTYRQTSTASYIENVLMAQRQISYLSPNDSKTILGTVTSNLSLVIMKDKTINLSFQTIDSRNANNNESYQCRLSQYTDN